MSSTHLEAIEQARKTGNESFLLNCRSTNFSLLEFWQWSASDLVSNVTRGRLAEFLIAKALGLADETRLEWDAYDLRMPSGLKIEVKSCAYVQSWRQLKLTPIKFSIPMTKAWSEESRSYTETAIRQADVYVFALLAHIEKQTINALDLDQWHFYVLPTAKLGELTSAKSITLQAIQKHQPEPLRWDEIRPAVEALVDL